MRERRIRQEMRVTRTIKTKVEENDWKSCPTCVMQVLLLPFEEDPEVLFKRQGGKESRSSLESMALMELAGVGNRDGGDIDR